MATPLYTACYCEENIWHLCADTAVGGSNKKVVWIGSIQGYCPLWQQRAASQPDQAVWWDYHVILLSYDKEWMVWDLDTRLDLPVSSREYYQKTFLHTQTDMPMFRVMDAGYYQAVFASDRSHMQTPDSSWLAPPPEWPAINNGNLSFLEMLDFKSDKHGTLLNINDMQHNY